MSNETNSNWVGVEGKKGGLPMLWRIRRITSHLDLHNRFPELFVLIWSYETDDVTRLPDSDFYSRLQQFEDAVVTHLENQQDGILVGTETGCGKVEYFFYVKSSEIFARNLDLEIPQEEPVEYASTVDVEWLEYQRLLQLAQN